MTPTIKFLEAQQIEIEPIQKLIKQIMTEFEICASSNEFDDLKDVEQNYAAGFFGKIVWEHQIIGSLGLFPISKEAAELRKIYVLPEFRGKGIGKAALQFLLSKAKELGYGQLTLDTSGRFTRAIDLYKKMGFKEFSNPNKSCSASCELSFRLDLPIEN